MKEFAKRKLKQHKNFVIYTLIGGIVTVLNILLLWIFVDIRGHPAWLTSIWVVGSLFLFRYYLFKKTGFTK